MFDFFFFQKRQFKKFRYQRDSYKTLKSLFHSDFCVSLALDLTPLFPKNLKTTTMNLKLKLKFKKKYQFKKLYKSLTIRLFLIKVKNGCQNLKFVVY